MKKEPTSRPIVTYPTRTNKKKLFGGLDVAIRVDNTSFCSLELREDGVLEQYGLLFFPHIHPKKIGETLAEVNKEDPHIGIGFDRLGTGELVNLFPPSIVKLMHPIISSVPGKQDMIGLLRSLLDAKKIVIHDDDLVKEILEQEKYISDAGNALYRHPSGFHDDRFWSLAYAAQEATSFLKYGHRVKIAVAQSTNKQKGIITEEMLNTL